MARDQSESKRQALEDGDYRAWQQAYSQYLSGDARELLDEKLVLRREEGDWRRCDSVAIWIHAPC